MYYFIKINFGTVGVSVGGPSITNIDTRLWAYLRILYAKSEDDITKHGYTPFSLQATGSVLSAEIEKEVVKTLVGVVGIILRVYGSDMKVIPPPLLSSSPPLFSPFPFTSTFHFYYYIYFFLYSHLLHLLHFILSFISRVFSKCAFSHLSFFLLCFFFFSLYSPQLDLSLSFIAYPLI